MTQSLIDILQSLPAVKEKPVGKTDTLEEQFDELEPNMNFIYSKKYGFKYIHRCTNTKITFRKYDEYIDKFVRSEYYQNWHHDKKMTKKEFLAYINTI